MLHHLIANEFDYHIHPWLLDYDPSGLHNHRFTAPLPIFHAVEDLRITLGESTQAT